MAPLAGESIEIGEYLLLELHVLEHRLDHQIGACRLAKADTAGDARDPGFGLILRDPLLGEARLDFLPAIGNALCRAPPH